MQLFRASGLLVFLLLASHAAAQETVRREHHNVNISVKREGRIAYYASPGESCGRGGEPEITIVEQPSYGKIILRPDRLLAQASTVPPRSAACRGEFVDATAIFYKPAPGFRGSDRLVLRIYFPDAPNGPASTLIDEIFIAVR